MTSMPCMLLAALPDSALLPNALPTQAQDSLRGVIPVLLAIVAVVAAVLFWAVFLRKSPRTHRRGALLEGEVPGDGTAPRAAADAAAGATIDR